MKNSFAGSLYWLCLCLLALHCSRGRNETASRLPETVKREAVSCPMPSPQPKPEPAPAPLSKKQMPETGKSTKTSSN